MVKRGYADMTADLFHYGHVNFLKQARSQCDHLIIGVHNDIAVASYKRKPVMCMDERIAVVEGCRYVDEIIPEAPVHLTENYIKDNQIDIIFTVDNRSVEEMKLMYETPMNMDIMKYIKYTDTISTTDIIKRVRDRSDL
jgi:cytidyltransferase-like protein